MWASIELGRPLTHCKNTTFIYHDDLSKYMNVEGAPLEDAFDYFFDVGTEKFILEKGKKYLHELLERWDPEHLQLNEDFDGYLHNDKLEDIIGEEGIQNLKKDDWFCQYSRL